MHARAFLQSGWSELECGVYRTVKLFEETGTVFSYQGCRENTQKSLSAYDEIAIIEMILDSPSMFLHEIQAAL